MATLKVQTSINWDVIHAQPKTRCILFLPTSQKTHFAYSTNPTLGNFRPKQKFKSLLTLSHTYDGMEPAHAAFPLTHAW